MQTSIRDDLMKRPVRRPLDSTAASTHDIDTAANAFAGPQPAAGEVALQCLRLMLDDGAWRDLGFAERPRHGALLQVFRPRWRRALDKTLKREILCGLTAAHAAAGLLDADGRAEVVSLYAADPLLFEPLGYASRAEAIAELGEGLDAYLAIPATQWPALLAIRLQIRGLPDKRLAAQLDKGAQRFARRLIARVAHLRRPR